MTIPIIILLCALVLCLIGALILVAIGTLACIDDDETGSLLTLGVVLSLVFFLGCIAGVAYHDDGQVCRLAPSSLVEKPTP